MEIKNDLLIKDNRPYVLWRRVSTKGQGESGLGLEAQFAIAKMFTRRDPVKVFTEVHTGTALRDCKELWKAVAFCKENNYLLVIAKTDRFRNVKEALEVLDQVGEGNLSFCDMPMVNRMILTIMFSVWESQALMGKINTKLALNVIRDQISKNGYAISKAGRKITHLGREKGCDLTTSVRAANKAQSEKAAEWRAHSVGYQWVKRQLAKGRKQKDILQEFNENMQMGIPGFETRWGKPLTWGVLSLWVKELGFRN